VDIPDGLRVTVWLNDYGSFTNFPASELAAAPAGIEGRYQRSDSPWWLPPEPGPLIRFGFSCLAVSGQGFEQVGELGAEIASRLAAMAGDWPSGTAYTVLLPVISFSLTFEATPRPRRRTPAPSGQESVALALAAGLKDWAPGGNGTHAREAG